MNELFIVASKDKYRYAYKGVILTEDLWDLSLEELDKVYSKLVIEQEEKSKLGKSLLSNKTAKDTELENKVKIVEYIFTYKKGLLDKAKERAVKKQERAKLLAIKEAKMNAELQGKSIEEIDKLLAELEAE